MSRGIGPNFMNAPDPLTARVYSGRRRNVGSENCRLNPEGGNGVVAVKRCGEKQVDESVVLGEIVATGDDVRRASLPEK